jgi:hypothetical protein
VRTLTPDPSPARTAQARRGLLAVASRPVTVAAATLLVAVCVAPVLAAGIDAFGKTWHPAGDWSVIELRTRDVGSASTPLVGPYSRFGWNHPGPLLFWILAVPYRLLGQGSTAVLLSAAAVNAASVVGLAVLAWRRGRLPLVAATTVGTALLCTHVGPSFLRDPWNPSITALPFAVVVFLAWSAWEGERFALPFLALGGSFLVQSHVGFAALVAALWLVGGIGFVRRQPRRRATVAWTAAVLAACWLPIVIDQITGTGNLGELARYFVGGSGEHAAGWSTALGVLARELGGVAPWLGGVERGNAVDGGVITESTAALLVPLAAFIGALMLARWRQAASAVRFQALVAVVVVAGFFSVARITGPVYGYLVRWLWVVALLWWLSVFWSLWSSVFSSPSVWPAVRRAAVVAVAVVAVIVVTRASVRTGSGIDRIGMPDGEWYVTLDEIVDDVVASTPREGPVLVRAVGSNNGSIADALRLQLDRHSIPVAVDPDQRHKYGQARLAESQSPVAVMTVATGAMLAEPFGSVYGTVVARWDPLEPDERQYALQLEDRLDDQFLLSARSDLITALRTGGSLQAAHWVEGVDQELLAAVERYRREGDPVTVYLELASPDPSPGGS